MEVPLGLWQPVQLEYVGSIAIDWLRLKPTFEGTDGRLEVEARLRNLDGRQMDGEVELSVPSPGREPLRLRREVRLGGGMEQTVTMRLALPGAKRWQPWRLGEQPLYHAEIVARSEGGESSRIDDVFAFRELSWDIGPRRWSFAVNGRPIFLRGACYAPAYRLDELNARTFAADLATARKANVDALRVVANVLPTDFYRQADEAGMLVFQDLPLTGTYVYHGRTDETRFFETAAREQQAQMVTLLHNHPSVVMWIAHDDPPWLATNFDLGDVHAVRQNHSIDQDLKSNFERLDPSRPSIAASGDVDLHLGLGRLCVSPGGSAQWHRVRVARRGARSKARARGADRSVQGDARDTRASRVRACAPVWLPAESARPIRRQARDRQRRPCGDGSRDSPLVGHEGEGGRRARPGPCARRRPEKVLLRNGRGRGPDRIRAGGERDDPQPSPRGRGRVPPRGSADRIRAGHRPSRACLQRHIDPASDPAAARDTPLPGRAPG